LSYGFIVVALYQQIRNNMSGAIFRILDQNRNILYTGGNSWMTKEQAKSLVNYDKGEMIYEFWNGEPLHEVF